MDLILVLVHLEFFPIIMFILVLGTNSTYNQYNLFPIILDPFRIISLVFRFLTKYTVRKNSTLNLTFVPIKILFLLLLGTYKILEMLFIFSIFNFVIKFFFLQHRDSPYAKGIGLFYKFKKKYQQVLFIITCLVALELKCQEEF